MIETERLQLRPLTIDDLEDLLALHAEPAVQSFMGQFDRPRLIEWISMVEVDWLEYEYGRAAIVDRATGRFVGRAGLKYWPQFEETEVGWVLHPDVWGRGIATEAARAWVRWGLANLPRHGVRSDSRDLGDQRELIARYAGRRRTRHIKQDRRSACRGVLLGSPHGPHRLRSHDLHRPLTAEYDRKETRLMKTMTCRQLGGPCDFALHGTTADEVIKAQDRHLQEMVAGGDDTHEGALKEMKGRWKKPISGMAWYRKTKRDYAALPED